MAKAWVLDFISEIRAAQSPGGQSLRSRCQRCRCNPGVILMPMLVGPECPGNKAKTSLSPLVDLGRRRYDVYGAESVMKISRQPFMDIRPSLAALTGPGQVADTALKGFDDRIRVQLYHPPQLDM